MNTFTTELIGMIGTSIILVAFLMTGEKKIRLFNLVGAFVSVFYGIIKVAPSVLILNGALILIHIYKLSKLKQSKEDIENVSIPE